MLEYNRNHIRAFIPTIKKAKFIKSVEFNSNHIKAYNLIPLNSLDIKEEKIR